MQHLSPTCMFSTASSNPSITLRSPSVNLTGPAGYTCALESMPGHVPRPLARASIQLAPSGDLMVLWKTRPSTSMPLPGTHAMSCMSSTRFCVAYGGRRGGRERERASARQGGGERVGEGARERVSERARERESRHTGSERRQYHRGWQSCSTATVARAGGAGAPPPAPPPPSPPPFDARSMRSFVRMSSIHEQCVFQGPWQPCRMPVEAGGAGRRRGC